MILKKKKIFKDPVHGYIEIPSDICSDFIDTELFQRLHYIEQTTMRWLYPAARHDRFSHSIGTYYIARRIFDNLIIEIELAVKHKKQKIEEFYNTFCIAALLHDCAHSPFSHTGESFTKLYCAKEIEDIIRTKFGKDYANDYYKTDGASSHEIASAYIAQKYFKNELIKHNVNIIQMVRMITGIPNDTNNHELKIYNCLISLINGFIIDADRLDYLQRDTWATGIHNINVDIERLIKGLSLDVVNGKVQIMNSASSSLINAVLARDYIYRWIVVHHKVVYINHILKSSINELIKKLSKTVSERNSEIVIGKNIFSPSRMLKFVNIDGINIYMPTDGDILFMIKKYCHDNIFCRELLARSNSFKPLWKSIQEFDTLFKFPEDSFGQDKKDDFYKIFFNKIETYCKTIPKNCAFCEYGTVKTCSDKLIDIEYHQKGMLSGISTVKVTDDNMNYKRTKHYYAYVFVKENTSISAKKCMQKIKNIYNSILKEYK